MLKHCQIWTVTSTDPRHERFSLELLGGLTDYSPQTHKKFLPQTSSEHPKNEIVTIIRKKNIFNIILVKKTPLSQKRLLIIECYLMRAALLFQLLCQKQMKRMKRTAYITRGHSAQTFLSYSCTTNPNYGYLIIWFCISYIQNDFFFEYFHSILHLTKT